MADIATIGVRVKTINAQAQTFVDSEVDPDFPDIEGLCAHIEFSSDALVIWLTTWLSSSLRCFLHRFIYFHSNIMCILDGQRVIGIGM